MKPPVSLSPTSSHSTNQEHQKITTISGRTERDEYEGKGSTMAENLNKNDSLNRRYPNFSSYSNKSSMSMREMQGEQKVSEGNTKNVSEVQAINSMTNTSSSTTISKDIPPKTTEVANAVSCPITLPNYYNSNVINPNKYAEQMQKRKLLWGSKKTDESTVCKWEKAQFSEDTDGKVASKFLRLMGIKNSSNSQGTMPQDSASDGKEKNNTSTSAENSIDKDIKSREKMFSSMEQQYEVARMTTHTMRGVGLGFGTQSKNYFN